MKELSLNILDIAQNSLKADARQLIISLREDEQSLRILIEDDGKGMDRALLASVTDPFTTTRSTRKVGMGIPLFKLAAEQTGGKLDVVSVSRQEDPIRHGTKVEALFYKEHLDFTPLGDIVSTLLLLIQGSPQVDILFMHCLPKGGEVKLDTRQLKEVLGEEVPLNSYEVLQWIQESLKEAYQEAL